MDPIRILTDASEWVKPLPKFELHIHLEGSMRSNTVREMSVARLGWEGPLEEGWENTYYTYTDFAGFMSQLTPRAPYRPDEYARIARECFEDQARLNVIYTEPSFDVPTRKVGDDSRFWPIMEALEAERLRAQDRRGMRINYIGGLMRTLPPEIAEYRVRLVAEARDRGYGITGVDLHGDEPAGAAETFGPAFQLARELGLGRRAHAGEALGPESIWTAIEILGATRVAHGIRAVEDPSLVERLEEGNVTLEIAPTSNVRTAIVPSIEEHPIRWLFDHGIPVTVASDDPLPFFTDVEREYRLLVETFGFTLDELRRLNLNAARAAFITDDERQRLIATVNTAYDAAGQGLTLPSR
jgi:adenosine deaminase